MVSQNWELLEGSGCVFSTIISTESSKVAGTQRVLNKYSTNEEQINQDIVLSSNILVLFSINNSKPNKRGLSKKNNLVT